MSEHNNITTYSDDDECVFRVQQFPNIPTTPITIDGLSIPVVIYSGTTVNIVDIDTYYKLRTLKKVQITPSNIRVFKHGSTIPLNILGTINVNVECNGKRVPAQFVVVKKQGTGCLIGHMSSTQLDFCMLPTRSPHNPRTFFQASLPHFLPFLRVRQIKRLSTNYPCRS